MPNSKRAAELLERLDLACAGWVGTDPDAYVVSPTLLWTGQVPSS